MMDILLIYNGSAIELECTGGMELPRVKAMETARVLIDIQMDNMMAGREVLPRFLQHLILDLQQVQQQEHPAENGHLVILIWRITGRLVLHAIYSSEPHKINVLEAF